MTRLMLILFAIVSTTLMGTGMIIALTMGYDTLTPLLVAIVSGFLLAIPASWLITRQIVD